MIDTTPLTEAAFDAETKDEMQKLRNLANSIAYRSPYAWKLYYSGQAKRDLSKRGFKALEICIKRAEKWDERRMAKRKTTDDGSTATPSQKKPSSSPKTSNPTPKTSTLTPKTATPSPKKPSPSPNKSTPARNTRSQHLPLKLSSEPTPLRPTKSESPQKKVGISGPSSSAKRAGAMSWGKRKVKQTQERVDRYNRRTAWCRAMVSKGAKLVDPGSDEEEESVGANDTVLPPVVCALKAPNAEITIAATTKACVGVRDKGKEKEIVAVDEGISGEGRDDEKVSVIGGGLKRFKIEPDEEDVIFANPDWAPKWDIFVEDGDGGFQKFPMYQKIDSGQEFGPDLPMSPYISEGDPHPACISVGMQRNSS